MHQGGKFESNMNEMAQDCIKSKNQMIEEILNYSDLYDSRSELETLDYLEVKHIYNSSMISFLKRINNKKSESK